MFCVRGCNNVRIVYTKPQSPFQHCRIHRRFCFLLMSNAAGQAKLQFLQLYCACVCQVNSTDGSDGWYQECAAISCLHWAGGNFGSFRRREENGTQLRAEQDYTFPWCFHLSSSTGVSPLFPHVGNPRNPRYSRPLQGMVHGKFHPPWKSQQDLINWVRKVRVSVTPVLTLLLYL